MPVQSIKSISQGNLNTIFRPQVKLLSKDYGKHLLEVEDMLQKQSLQEADISIQADRVQTLNTAALKFTTIEGECVLKQSHCEHWFRDTVWLEMWWQIVIWRLLDLFFGCDVQRPLQGGARKTIWDCRICHKRAGVSLLSLQCMLLCTHVVKAQQEDFFSAGPTKKQLHSLQKPI